ncbi:hypothetical protein AALP_AA3G108600 [Arabis alpina]|uniref:Acidic protein n=1 Tax=Arabis alpina TaxID=50452 RepID=A0A087H8F2_ARAAL|nr:hypothetical protein AALP_AA3G108600 [Arabis alpina]
MLLTSMMLAHIQVDAKFCCMTKVDKQNLIKCVDQRILSPYRCVEINGCKEFRYEWNCPPGYPAAVLENSGDIVNEYCKLGCVSSECGALTTLHNSDASEIVNGAVEQCTSACSSLCTKGSKTALEAA